MEISDELLLKASGDLLLEASDTLLLKVSDKLLVSDELLLKVSGELLLEASDKEVSGKFFLEASCELTQEVSGGLTLEATKVKGCEPACATREMGSVSVSIGSGTDLDSVGPIPCAPVVMVTSPEDASREATGLAILPFVVAATKAPPTSVRLFRSLEIVTCTSPSLKWSASTAPIVANSICGLPAHLLTSYAAGSPHPPTGVGAATKHDPASAGTNMVDRGTWAFASP